jgi:hypothetical protein
MRGGNAELAHKLEVARKRSTPRSRKVPAQRLRYEGWRMEETHWTTAWRSPPVVITLIGAVLLLGYFLVYRLPDLDERTKRLDTDVRDQLKAMNVALVGLRANVLRLCAQKRSLDTTCKTEEIVAQAESVTREQAEYFDSADVKLTDGAKPAVVSEGIQQQLPQYTLTTTESTKVKTIDKPAVANLILWSSAANSAKWHQAGDLVVGDFANGRVSLKMTAPLSKDHAATLVESLNATAGAFQASAANDSQRPRS